MSAATRIIFTISPYGARRWSVNQVEYDDDGVEVANKNAQFATETEAFDRAHEAAEAACVTLGFAVAEVWTHGKQVILYHKTHWKILPQLAAAKIVAAQSATSKGRVVPTIPTRALHSLCDYYGFCTEHDLDPSVPRCDQ